jgi:hypothetical protein
MAILFPFSCSKSIGTLVCSNAGKSPLIPITNLGGFYCGIRLASKMKEDYKKKRTDEWQNTVTWTQLPNVRKKEYFAFTSRLKVVFTGLRVFYFIQMYLKALYSCKTHLTRFSRKSIGQSMSP